MIIILLTLAGIIIIILFYNLYQTHQMKNRIYEQVNPTEDCKINRFVKTQYKQLKQWEIKDRMRDVKPIVVCVRNVPEDIAEEIITYSLKLMEEKMK